MRSRGSKSIWGKKKKKKKLLIRILQSTSIYINHFIRYFHAIRDRSTIHFLTKRRDTHSRVQIDNSDINQSAYHRVTFHSLQGLIDACLHVNGCHVEHLSRYINSFIRRRDVTRWQKWTDGTNALNTNEYQWIGFSSLRPRESYKLGALRHLLPILSFELTSPNPTADSYKSFDLTSPLSNTVSWIETYIHITYIRRMEVKSMAIQTPISIWPALHDRCFRIADSLSRISFLSPNISILRSTWIENFKNDSRYANNASLLWTKKKKLDTTSVSISSLDEDLTSSAFFGNNFSPRESFLTKYRVSEGEKGVFGARKGSDLFLALISFN